uniref:Uncharacterized protein n=1 Tax=Brassica oleracea var. oleracea TaxID=109376 RepID=A0A0D2ZZK8_BRAOL
MRKPKSKKKVLVEDEETPPQYEVGDPSPPDLRLPLRLFARDRVTGSPPGVITSIPLRIYSLLFATSFATRRNLKPSVGPVSGNSSTSLLVNALCRVS